MDHGSRQFTLEHVLNVAADERGFVPDLRGCPVGCGRRVNSPASVESQGLARCPYGTRCPPHAFASVPTPRLDPTLYHHHSPDRSLRRNRALHRGRLQGLRLDPYRNHPGTRSLRYPQAIRQAPKECLAPARHRTLEGSRLGRSVNVHRKLDTFGTPRGGSGPISSKTSWINMPCRGYRGIRSRQATLIRRRATSKRAGQSMMSYAELGDRERTPDLPRR